MSLRRRLGRLAPLFWGLAVCGCAGLSNVAITPRAPVGAGGFRVVTLNIAHGRGLALDAAFTTEAVETANLQHIGRMLAALEADVVLLQEVLAPHGEALSQAHVIAESGGYAHVFYTPHPEGDGSSEGTAVISRVPLLAHRNISFETSFRDRYGATIAAADIPLDETGATRRVVFVSVHLDALFEDTRDEQTDLLSGVLTGNDTLIIGGDFNCTYAEGHCAQRLRAALDLDLDQAQAPTYPETEPTRTLDWLLWSKDVPPTVGPEVLPLAVSDHRPLLMDVALRRPGSP